MGGGGGGGEDTMQVKLFEIMIWLKKKNTCQIKRDIMQHCLQSIAINVFTCADIFVDFGGLEWKNNEF